MFGLLVLWIISVATFGLFFVSPHDPAKVIAGRLATPQTVSLVRHRLGLDQPVYVQYWKFASRAVQGDFGKSWYTDTPAFKLVMERMPPTLYLTFAGLGMALLISLPLGILAALKRHSLVDNGRPSCCGTTRTYPRPRSPTCSDARSQR